MDVDKLLPELDVTEQASNKLRKLLEEQKKAETENLVTKLLADIDAGTLSYGMYRKLPKNTQDYYKSKWIHERERHIKGRPMNTIELAVQKTQLQRKKNAKKAAKQARKRNR